jgi:hypothetical protein
VAFEGNVGFVEHGFIFVRMGRFTEGEYVVAVVTRMYEVIRPTHASRLLCAKVLTGNEKARDEPGLWFQFLT